VQAATCAAQGVPAVFRDQLPRAHGARCTLLFLPGRIARRKYGLLEKKKDYVLRAKDFHRKEKTIKSLRKKAEERNPDEFYFAMEKARTKGGVHIARCAPSPLPRAAP